MIGAAWSISASSAPGFVEQLTRARYNLQCLVRWRQCWHLTQRADHRCLCRRGGADKSAGHLQAYGRSCGLLPCGVARRSLSPDRRRPTWTTSALHQATAKLNTFGDEGS